jgi:hypothetical protein
MPQIYMITNRRAFETLRGNIGRLASELIKIVENGFGLGGLNDVAFTAPAYIYYAKGEKDIQVEIRYTAGEDEYNRGSPFDPSLAEQKKLTEDILFFFDTFLSGPSIDKNKPKLSVSVWCKPYYNSVFSASD